LNTANRFIVHHLMVCVHMEAPFGFWSTDVVYMIPFILYYN